MMASLTATACAAKLKQQSTRCHQYQAIDQDQAAGGSTNQIRMAPSLSGRWNVSRVCLLRYFSEKRPSKAKIVNRSNTSL
jgi:hypothetical protein